MISKKESRIQQTNRWIKKRLKQIYRVTSYSGDDLRELQEPHRLHKRSFFSCSYHDCRICWGCPKRHDKIHKEDIEAQTMLQGLNDGEN